MVKYFITSGNSKTGNATIRALKDLGENDIVAGARDPVKSEKQLIEDGASEVVEFDFTKPDTVEKALIGVERILICHGDTDFTNFFKWTQTVIDYAKKTPSVKVIAGFNSDPSSEQQITKIHGDLFEMLKNSGLQYYAIGPAFFFENWLRNIDSIKTGTLYHLSGDTKVLYVAIEDIGATAAKVLKNIDQYNGQHVPIAGDLISEGDILKEITEAAGITAKYVSLPNNEYKETLIKSGIPKEIADLMAFLEEVKEEGGEQSNLKPLREVLEREPINARKWAQQHASEFKK